MTAFPPSPDLPYAGLTPHAVLDALDAAGLRGDGRILQLNSYENRVFQVHLEESLDPQAAPPAVVVAKFYRAGRWSDAQILEEHAFARELAEAEVPAVAPLALQAPPEAPAALTLQGTLVDSVAQRIVLLGSAETTGTWNGMENSLGYNLHMQIVGLDGAHQGGLTPLGFDISDNAWRWQLLDLRGNRAVMLHEVTNRTDVYDIAISAAGGSGPTTLVRHDLGGWPRGSLHLRSAPVFA